MHIKLRIIKVFKPHHKINAFFVNEIDAYLNLKNTLALNLVISRICKHFELEST